jgi:hypothetical protein
MATGGAGITAQAPGVVTGGRERGGRWGGRQGEDTCERQEEGAGGASLEVQCHAVLCAVPAARGCDWPKFWGTVFMGTGSCSRIF